MKCIIIGASSGLGRALAEELARQGHELLLVASDARDLQALSNDLALKTSRAVDFLACHIGPVNPGWFSELGKKISAWGAVDSLFLTFGRSSDRDQVDAGSEFSSTLIEINFTAVVKIISLCLPQFLARKQGSIVGFGSVSALRGRNSNVAYAAAKRALASYFESLRHAVASTAIRAQLYQLGYIDTQRTFGRKLMFPKADPNKTARYIIRNLDRDFGSMFYPRFWIFISFVVRFLPWRFFKKLKF